MVWVDRSKVFAHERIVSRRSRRWDVDGMWPDQSGERELRPATPALVQSFLRGLCGSRWHRMRGLSLVFISDAENFGWPVAEARVPFCFRGAMWWNG